jgi:hypothetical protein
VSTRICIKRTLRAGIVFGVLMLALEGVLAFLSLAAVAVITAGFLIGGAVVSLLALLQFGHVITPAAHRSSKSPPCG